MDQLLPPFAMLDLEDFISNLKVQVFNGLACMDLAQALLATTPDWITVFGLFLHANILGGPIFLTESGLVKNLMTSILGQSDIMRLFHKVLCTMRVQKFQLSEDMVKPERGLSDL